MASQTIDSSVSAPSASPLNAQGRGRWLPIVCFLAAVVCQWPPLVTHDYVRTDVFVLAVIVASAPWIAVGAGFFGALVGSAIVIAISGFDRELTSDFAIAMILAVAVGFVYRYLSSRVVWRRAWVGFIFVTLIVSALSFIATAADLWINSDSLDWVVIAQASLPVMIACFIAGAWTFAGHSRRTGMTSTRGWPMALSVVTAVLVAGQGFVYSWGSQERVALDASSKSVSDALGAVFVDDLNGFATTSSAIPSVPWSDEKAFADAAQQMFNSTPALVSSGLLEQQAGTFRMKFVADSQGFTAPQLASELGGAATDAAAISAVGEHSKLLGLRKVDHKGVSEVSAIYAATQAVAPGSPAQILTVAESLPKALSKAAERSLGSQQDTLHLTLETVPTVSNPEVALVAEQGVASNSRDLGVTPVNTSVAFGDTSLTLTASPGEGFGIDPNVRRLTWLALLFLAGSWLLIYFRGLMASDAIEESENRYRLLAENSADVVLQHSGSDQKITWVSPSLTGVLGWDTDQLLGKPLADFIHPDERARSTELISAAQRYRDVPASGELRFATLGGGWRWMSAATKTVAAPKAAEFTEAGIVSLRDIQDSVDSRQALEKSENLFRTSMESAAIGMAIVRLDGSFVVVNQSLCTMLRLEEDDLLAMNVDELVHADSMVHVRELGARMTGNEFDNVVEQLRLVRSDGVEVWARTAVARVPSAGEQHDVYLLQVEDITDEREARDLLAFRAFHDPLTGLRNRAWILDSLATDLEAAGRKGTSVGVLFIDLDHFKVVNDSLGHAAGDDYLVTVAERIKGSLRAIDRVGRFGGDEFVVVFPDVDNPRQLENAAERISTALGADLHLSGHRMVPSASIGIALATPASTPDSLLRDADSALYRAKYAGRARWQFFDKQMHEQALSRLTTEDELRDAIVRNEFVVHYQPIVALMDGELAGYEALVRWEHPTAGLMMPASFLDVAEASGLIAGIGPLVLERVCQDLVSRPDFAGHVAINVSAVELAQANWGKNFNAIINRHLIDPSRLVIEVTETAVLDMLPTTKKSLRALTSRGIGLHLDDFGTGFSSISILRDLPVSGVKLDRRFVQDVSSDEGAANALSRGLAGLVSGLDLAGIAEGVESSHQAHVLAEQGWGYGQGYYFGRPGPMPEREGASAITV